MMAASGKFQSTPPRGGRRHLSQQTGISVQFQSTPPRGGRHPVLLESLPLHIVSIHAPARGATTYKSVGDGVKVFQSTPPRGGRHETYHYRAEFVGEVSIHAPARGATTLLDGTAEGWESFNPRPREGGDNVTFASLQSLHKFQSTPPRGGRPKPRQKLHWLRSFQSTPPRGGRPGLLWLWPGDQPVSIHAPARGATEFPLHPESRRKVSIHAPARGATVKAGAGFSLFRGFNPRPREGGDGQAWPAGSIVEMFQSTPPRGGRRASRAYFKERKWFQSTPPRGGRRSLELCVSQRHVVSIHAPARGATNYLVVELPQCLCFNPRPREGGDRCPESKRSCQSSGWFQSTPPRGGRRGRSGGCD